MLSQYDSEAGIYGHSTAVRQGYAVSTAVSRDILSQYSSEARIFCHNEDLICCQNEKVRQE